MKLLKAGSIIASTIDPNRRFLILKTIQEGYASSLYSYYVALDLKDLRLNTLSTTYTFWNVVVDFGKRFR